MTAADVEIRTEWAVLGTDGKVVVIFSGTDAYVAAREWELRGYTIVAGRNSV
jgi:hypothetical protein